MYSEHKTLRWKEHDYSVLGMYFITIVTENRREILSGIIDGEVKLSLVGSSVKSVINDVPQKFTDIEILNYVIMPNHIHLLIFNNGGMSMIEFIRWFKGASARKSGLILRHKDWWREDFKLWQRSYYDVVIRNQHMLDYIDKYITVNPIRWENDKMNETCHDSKDEILKDIKSLK